MRLFVIFTLFIHFAHYSSGQIKYNLRAEIGTLRFQNTTIDVEPGPNWKGYNLNENQNGFSFDVINGISIKDKLRTGLGVGYVNFEGINGYSIFGDIQYLPLKTRLTPLINLKLGSNHIWNQYENGKQSVLFDLSGGLSFKFTGSYSAYFTSGLLLTQQAFLIPVRFGIRIK
ncbi:MAG: hypothetical protein OEY56_06315 [Cyclobacteriaceae bacterium]|nr:hypothetical protein [Cyclobacteriaceae bacterium]